MTTEFNGNRPSGLIRVSICSLAALAIAGCTTFSADGGFDLVAATAQSKLGKEVRWSRSTQDHLRIDQRVDELLSKPLSADDAVQVALLNNRALQASFEQLGISEAELVQSSRFPNPRLTFRRARNGDQYSIEQTLTVNFLSLLTVPYARDIGRRRFAQTQKVAIVDVLQLANQTRKAYFTAVAANESVRYLQQVMKAAETSAELARRMVQAGNWSRLDHAREQTFYADATQSFARARLAQDSSREDLMQLMGLWGERTNFQLAERLPDLPPQADELPNVEQTAMQSRIDLQMKREEIEALAKSLKLTRTTRFINVLDAGPTRTLDGNRSEPYRNGYEISFEIPLFDAGGARVRKAQATYTQAVDRITQSAIITRSEVRKAYTRYRTSYDIAKHQRNEIVPLHKLISAENQLRYNGMLISVFDLLADARAQIASVNDSIQSARDFWIAKSDLDASLLSGPSPTMFSSNPDSISLSGTLSR